jgi:hypothetical protein
MANEFDIYALTRNFFDWSFENPEKINTNHVALYYFILEHSNRLGWKEKFGLPTGMAMEAIGIKNYKTYGKTFSELVEFGFVKLIEKSKNQYSSNVIALVKNTKAHTKALTKASLKHIPKHCSSTANSTVSILIPSTNIQDTNIQNTEQPPEGVSFDFRMALLKYGLDDTLVNEWIQVRKKKRAVNSETAYNGFIRELEKASLPKNDVLRICVEKSWIGFDAAWIAQEKTKNFDELGRMQNSIFPHRNGFKP